MDNLISDQFGMCHPLKLNNQPAYDHKGNGITCTCTCKRIQEVHRTHECIKFATWKFIMTRPLKIGSDFHPCQVPNSACLDYYLAQKGLFVEKSHTGNLSCLVCPTFFLKKTEITTVSNSESITEQNWKKAFWTIHSTISPLFYFKLLKTF